MKNREEREILKKGERRYKKEKWEWFIHTLRVKPWESHGFPHPIMTTVGQSDVSNGAVEMMRDDAIWFITGAI